MKYAVERKTLETIATYLSMQPYKEVVGLIALIEQSKPLEEKKVTKETAEKLKAVKDG